MISANDLSERRLPRWTNGIRRTVISVLHNSVCALPSLLPVTESKPSLKQDQFLIAKILLHKITQGYSLTRLAGCIVSDGMAGAFDDRAMVPGTGAGMIHDSSGAVQVVMDELERC